MKLLKNKKIYFTGLYISIFLCLFGSLLANLAQTNFGTVTKKTISYIGSSGHTISADMLIPDSANKNTPAPAIVWAHGGNANKEKSDNFQIEWARRGFVVISIDLYGHGESEILNDTEWLDNGRGLYDTVKYITTIPYIDAERIAVAGHSRGGNTIHESILIDNKEKEPLIKAVLYVGRDAIYRDNETASLGYVPGKTNTTEAAQKGSNGEYFNYYGNRDVGIIADKYDDFSFKEKDNESQKIKPNPEFLKSNNAKSFLNFGIQPYEQTLDGIDGKWYEKEIDGKLAKRIIYMPLATHGTSIFSSKSCISAIEFMTNVFSVNTDLNSSNNIYLLKTAGNLLGFVGFFLFLVFFTLKLVKYEPFSAVSSSECAIMRKPGIDPLGKKWLLGCLVVNTIFPMISAIILFYFKVDKVINGFFMQGMPLFYGLWGAINAIFLILTTVVWYQCYAKKNGINLTSIDLEISVRNLVKTILTAIMVCVCAFLLLFAVKYFFNTDFRFLYWAVRPFNSQRLFQAMKLLPFFILSYVSTSVFINCLNFNEYFGKKESTNIFLLAFLNILPPLILAVLGYGYFFTTGVNGFYGANNQIPDWMVTPLLPLFITPFITRKIYIKTKNPYLGGVINAIVITLITCVNAQIVFPS